MIPTTGWQFIPKEFMLEPGMLVKTPTGNIHLIGHFEAQFVKRNQLDLITPDPENIAKITITQYHPFISEEVC